MAELWTELIDPDTLTNYLRRSLQDYEEAKGTLAVFLPNRYVEDITARFVSGQYGLVSMAHFRAYDAEPEIGKVRSGKRHTIELPAIGKNIPVSEYTQLKQRNASDQIILDSILDAGDQVIRGVADAIEYLRGVVLATGKATIDDGNFQSEDNFGRPAEHSTTLTTLWSDPTADRLEQLEQIHDTYEQTTGQRPGTLLMSRAAYRAFANGNQFATQLLDGSNRNGTRPQIDQYLADHELAPIRVYSRKVQNDAGQVLNVLPTDKMLVLPAPVATDDYLGTELGATFWGRTLTSMDPNWGIAESSQPGVVAGVYRNAKPPMGAEIISDGIALPVLANASLSMDVKVI